MFKEEKQAIKDLDTRIKDFVSKDETRKERKSSGLDFGIRVLSDLVAGVVVGFGMGYFLDGVFDTKPTLMIIFLVLGVCGSFLNVYRTVNDYYNKQDAQELDKQGNE